MCPERDKWMEAMEREMASLKVNDVYDLVELPKDRKLWEVNGYTNEKSSVMDQLRDLSQDWLLKVSHNKLDKTMMKRSIQSSGLNPFAQSLQWQFKMK